MPFLISRVYKFLNFIIKNPLEQVHKCGKSTLVSMTVGRLCNRVTLSTGSRVC